MSNIKVEAVAKVEAAQAVFAVAHSAAARAAEESARADEISEILSRINADLDKLSRILRK